jgi:hypothetical protein
MFSKIAAKSHLANSDQKYYPLQFQPLLKTFFANSLQGFQETEPAAPCFLMNFIRIILLDRPDLIVSVKKTVTLTRQRSIGNGFRFATIRNK